MWCNSSPWPVARGPGCLLGGPEVGGIAQYYLRSQGSSKWGTKSETTTSPLPSRDPKEGRRATQPSRSQGSPRGRYTHRAHRVVHRVRTALRFLPTLSCIFHIFSGWQGRGGLRGKHTTTEASTPSSSPMVVVAAHTPCQGRAVGRGRRGCRTLRYGRSTEEPSAPQGAQAYGAVSNVSRFAVLNALVSRFGVLLLGVPRPRK